MSCLINILQGRDLYIKYNFVFKKNNIDEFVLKLVKRVFF